jgi:hypothetical protein
MGFIFMLSFFGLGAFGDFFLGMAVFAVLALRWE